MGFSIEITTTDADTELNVLKAIRDKLDVVLKHAAGAIQLEIADLADKLIRNTEEYESLLSGQLMAELGLADPKRRLDGVLQGVRDGVRVWSTPLRVSGKSIDGGLNIGVLTSQYDEILNLADASYVSPPSGTEINWLGWLIGAGDRIIIFNYDVVPALTAAQRAKSRSKKALMFKGKGWRVPAKYSGTFTDNFLTRAFDAAGVEAAMDKIVETQIMKRL